MGIPRVRAASTQALANPPRPITALGRSLPQSQTAAAERLPVSNRELTRVRSHLRQRFSAPSGQCSYPLRTTISRFRHARLDPAKTIGAAINAGWSSAACAAIPGKRWPPVPPPGE